MAGATSNEQLALTAPKGIIAVVVALLLGGGVGAGVAGVSQGRTATEAAMPWLTRAEVVEVATAAEGRARNYTDAAISKHADISRRELESAQNRTNATLGRIEARLDAMATSVERVSQDVAVLKAQSGRRK